jgi:hypothetical protein
MSITSDIRAYADSALGQGKQVLESGIAKAQTQLNDVTGQANELVRKLTEKADVFGLTGKATGVVHDLRSQAEKAINLNALKSATEPYLTQARGYTATVTDRAEELVATVKNDKRVAKLVTTAGSLTGTVVETVQDKLVRPVQSLAGHGTTSAPEPATTPVIAPAASTTTADKTADTPAPVKATAKPAVKATVRKAPVHKATEA